MGVVLEVICNVYDYFEIQSNTHQIRTPTHLVSVCVHYVSNCICFSVIVNNYI